MHKFTTHPPATHLNMEERLARLQLAWSERIGPVTFRHLINRYGTAVSALEALPDLAAKGGGKRPPKIFAADKAKKEMDTLERFGAALLMEGDDDYPAILTHTDGAPPVLLVAGHIHLLKRRSVAIVGARNASGAGQKLAENMARGLGEADLIVTSGLARGIDTAAHRGALLTGTIAVLGCGLDIPYPRENKILQETIAEQGLLISEHPMATKPQANHFPRRNRIISGLSLGLIVVEAALRSGSLITARLAAEQGREVMAVPGSPLDPRAAGTNDLIRDGAILVTSVEDVLENLASLAPKQFSEQENDLFSLAPTHFDEKTLQKARTALLDLLSSTPLAVDDLIRITQLPAPVVVTVLLEMEIAGTAERRHGNRVVRIF